MGAEGGATGRLPHIEPNDCLEPLPVSIDEGDGRDRGTGQQEERFFGKASKELILGRVQDPYVVETLQSFGFVLLIHGGVPVCSKSTTPGAQPGPLKACSRSVGQGYGAYARLGPGGGFNHRFPRRRR